MSWDKEFQALQAAAAQWDLALSQKQQEQIQYYLEALVDYNRKTNLTAEAEPRDLLLRHIADGLAAVPVIKSVIAAPSLKIADLGAGGGFIGIAIKIAWPQAQVTLIESLQRKFDFLNLTAVRLGLPGLRVARKVGGETKFHAVVARALAPLPEALSLAIPLVAASGFFASYQSAPPDLSQTQLQRRLDLLSARLVKSIPYRLPEETKDRYLALFSRIASQGEK